MLANALFLKNCSNYGMLGAVVRLAFQSSVLGVSRVLILI